MQSASQATVTTQCPLVCVVVRSASHRKGPAGCVQSAKSLSALRLETVSKYSTHKHICHNLFTINVKSLILFLTFLNIPPHPFIDVTVTEVSKIIELKNLVRHI